MFMFRVVLFVVLSFLFLLFTLQQDDELGTESESLIARFTEDKTSEAYLYLLGIYAQEGDDPIALGKQILEASSSPEQSGDLFNYPDSKKLSLPEGDGFCMFDDENCIGYLFSGSVKVARLIENYRELLERSDRFFQYDEYRTMAQPTPDEIYPEYKYLFRAQRIKLLEAISLYKCRDVDGAVESLLTQFSVVRRANERQDNLVGKMVLLHILSDILDALSVILSETDTHIETIPRLSVSEKDFGRVSAREFGILYYGVRSLDKNPGLFEINGEFNDAPEWLVRALFKPNMTINALAPRYLIPESLAVLSPAEFAMEVENPEIYISSTSLIRNPVGNILLGIEGATYEKYVAKVHDLDVKIALFNQLHHLRLDASSLINPYYGKEAPSMESGKLCFSGPLVDKNSLRCLPVAL